MTDVVQKNFFVEGLSYFLLIGQVLMITGTAVSLNHFVIEIVVVWQLTFSDLFERFKVSLVTSAQLRDLCS